MEADRYALLTKHPTETPTIVGGPKIAANGIRQSAIRSWITAAALIPCKITITAYKEAKMDERARSLLSNRVSTTS